MNPFEPEIRAFEARDRRSPPEPGGIVCVGSSTFTFWDNLAKDLSPLPVLNRGFGGSELSDSLHFADRIVIPYRPRVVALYAGDNDLANGKSPDAVVRDFQQFAQRVFDALPATKIVYISIKYSIARWYLIDQIRAVNAAIRALAEADPRLGYIDTATPMLGPDGLPRRELFVEDLLHLSREGYLLWATILRAELGTVLSA